VQDQVRYQTKIEKQEQFGLPFGGPIPKSSKSYALQKRYSQRAREKVITSLMDHRGVTMSYDALYGEVMSLPLITESDLNHILLSLHPNVRLQLVGHRRKKPVLFRGDSVVINSRDFNRSDD
jgi:redox-sensitive bicupin YhaK (pirin superfamily)